MAADLSFFATAGHGLQPLVSPAAQPATPPAPVHRRGRLRNGATPGDFLAAPRCGARTRAGGCCRQPAMRNGRCRMHGGLSTGPRTPAGRARCAAARRTHGFYSAETVALRREAGARVHRLRALIASVSGRRTAGHGVLPPEIRSQKPEARKPQADPQRATSRRDALLTSGFCLLASGSTAGHGLLPSLFSPSPDASRPVRRPPGRQGLRQRCLLGSTALGLGLTVAPPAAAGHGVHPPVSAAPPRRPAGVRG